MKDQIVTGETAVFDTKANVATDASDVAGGRRHQRRNAFILIHVAERIFAAGGLQHNTLSQPSVATR